MCPCMSPELLSPKLTENSRPSRMRRPEKRNLYIIFLICFDILAAGRRKSIILMENAFLKFNEV